MAFTELVPNEPEHESEPELAAVADKDSVAITYMKHRYGHGSAYGTFRDGEGPYWAETSLPAGSYKPYEITSGEIIARDYVVETPTRIPEPYKYPTTFPHAHTTVTIEPGKLRRETTSITTSRRVSYTTSDKLGHKFVVTRLITDVFKEMRSHLMTWFGSSKLSPSDPSKIRTVHFTLTVNVVEEDGPTS